MGLLPVEVYIEILRFLPCTRDDPAEETLLNCLQANSVLRAAALASSVWQKPYQTRYIHCDEARERERKARCAGDWRLMYVERRSLDRRALRVLDEIRTEGSGRHEKARMFTQEFSYDVWDALKRETSLTVPHWFPDGAREGVAIPSEAMPKRFWAQAALGIIARYNVMNVWARAVDSESSATVTFEEGLAGMSAFFDESPIDVLAQLETIYTQCRERLVAQNVILEPTQPGYNLWHLCEKIREAMHSLGFCVAGGSTFYSVLNQFPHAFLEPLRRKTIPMALVYVFVAVARKLGIDAAPTNFPGVVQAHIQPSDPDEPPRIMDIRTTDPPSPVPNPDGIQATALQVADAFGPASAASMLSRASNNLIMFIRYERTRQDVSSQLSPWSLETCETAFYAMTCWVLVESQTEQLIATPPDSKPLDALAVLVDAVCPHLDPLPRSALSSSCYKLVERDEAESTEVTNRSKYPEVKHFVGLIFRHAKYHYEGCITGWDPRCMQSQEWIEEMNVDGLLHGRDQPFYHVLATDGQPRYVAQDNIIPILPTKVTLSLLYRGRLSFSRYFVDVEVDEGSGLGRLIPSLELKTNFPEDDAYGAQCIRG